MDLVGLVAVLGFFGIPLYMIKRIFEHKRHRLELEAGKGARGGDDPEVKRLVDENRRLRERVENLESIVCGVELELNQKLVHVLDEHRSLLLAPPAAPDPALVPAAASARTSAVAPSALAGPTGPAPRAQDAAGAAAAPDAPGGVDRTLTGHGRARPMPLSTTLEPGQVLAQRYRIQRLLGKGGMGAVYLADDEVLGELVALKVIASAWASDEQAMIARFRREAAAARKVSSPAVIRIHDLGEARPGLLYLSMEYFAGRTLAELIAQRGVVPLRDARDILEQIAAGLEAAHQAGVIHRDLKPSNVLIGERGAVKLIDFGLATTAVVDRLTATGAILGTPHYMAPEQVRGKAVDVRTDVYALGALAYHLVCGRPPFAGDNAIAIGFAHLTEAPAAPRQLRKDIPAGLEAAILAALAKSPDERPVSARAFIEQAFAG